MLKILNDLYSSLDQGKLSILTLLDLTAAFDTIDHSTLLSRLHNTFGISHTALAWFYSYLTHRSQLVSVNGVKSASSPVQFGVPQGSVLGPVLFVLYIQPLFDTVSQHSINQHAFADDNQLYKETTLDQFQPTLDTMQICLSDVKSWMSHNKLLLNDSKTECLLVKSQRLVTPPSLPSSVSVGDTDIEFVPSVKNLGVTLDCHLSLSDFVQNTCKSAYIQLRQISAIRHFLTAQATSILVCALILSRLDYCNGLLAGSPKCLTDKLQRVQNAAARLICKSKKSDHITPLLRSLHWLPVSARVQYKIACVCYNYFTASAPQYLSELLHTYTPSRPLRSSTDSRILTLPIVRTKSYGQRSFSYQAPSIWNDLPHSVRHSTSPSSFRSALKTHLFLTSLSD